ncbi:MAG TPA: glycosyltransferase family 4 protein [archaeon]|nr:glycosyltransferase family 4 protein [archaeon]
MKLFLSHAGLGEVRGGVEVYAQHLSKVFKSLEIVDYHSHKKELGDTLNPLLREPERAKKLGEFVKKNYPDARIFSNGMFCWNLVGKNQINISHGTYAAFAERAISPFSLDFYRLRYIYSHFEKIAAKNASLVVVNSSSTSKNVKTFLGPDSKIIYPPVDFENFRPIAFEKARDKLGWKGVNVLFIGRAERAKGFDLIEKAALKNSNINFKCILSRPYECRIKNIEIIPPVAHSNLPTFYSACDVVLFPSRFEGFGLVLPEALACNKKIVALNTGIAGEIKDPNIFISEPTSWGIEKALMEALSKEPYNSRPAMQKIFSFERFAKKWKEADKLIDP